ncbi:MAG: rhodanese-like domain-containing protein [Candidatus Promineifilaceae bacterium]|nr:rhodanese-like domain-containing protein [Candidatus Promineifilaceae bacterium]
MGVLDFLLGRKAKQITVDAAYERALDPESPALIVDVRQPLERRSGAIPGSVNLPLTQLRGGQSRLPADRPLLTICRSGHRSPLAARMLKRAGYEVLDVEGGMQAWEDAGLPLDRG